MAQRIPDFGSATSTADAHVSLIIEWENPLHAGAERAAAMLGELRAQLEELCSGGPVDDDPFLTRFEILIVFDDEEFDRKALNGWLENILGPPGSPLPWRLLASDKSGYYEAKDVGARAATGEWLLFLDSDVIPERGWLRRLLAATKSSQVGLVAGSAYLDPSNLTGKVFALIWFFPLRHVGNEKLREVDWFFANNFAVRRSLYLEFPFPAVEGSSRGACLILARRLRAAGIPIHQQPAAQVNHPPPNGLRHIVLRALAQGRDRVLRERFLEGASGVFSSITRWVRHVGGATRRVLRDHRQVSLSVAWLPLALAAGAGYYSLYWLGEIATHLRVPGIARIRI